MANNGIVIGGDQSLKGGEYRQGVYARHPAMTPKYARGLEYMARFMVPFSANDAGLKARNDYIQAVPRSATELAMTLATVSSENPKWRTEGMAGAAPAGKPGGVAGGYGYIDFLLQQVQESYQEKIQIVDVLSDNYVSYCFGQNPPVFNYTGLLYNSLQDDWRAAFTVLYQEMLRATKLARQKQVVILSYDDVFVTGVLISMSQTLVAETQIAAAFNFSMLVKRYDVNQRDNRSAVFFPTQLNSYPFKVTPDAFTSPAIAGTDTTQWAAPGVIYTTKQREKTGVGGFVDSTIDFVAPTLDAQYKSETMYNAAKGAASGAAAPPPVGKVATEKVNAFLDGMW